MGCKGSTILILLFHSVCFLFTDKVSAQTVKDTTALSEVVLLSTQIKSSLQNKAASVSVLTAEDLMQTDGVIITSALNKIPGVYMQQGALNTNRITLRGIGARSQFSTNRVKAYFDEIPLSDAEGETIIEDIDLETINRIEIIKGPNDVSYGSGLGGVISIYGKESLPGETTAKATGTLGSFGLYKQTVSAGQGWESSSIYANFSSLESDGFRENSNYDRKSYNLRARHQLGEKSALSFIGIFTRLKAFIPSSINEEAFINNPESAATNWAAAQGFESYDRLLAGVGFTHLFYENLEFKSSVFYNLRDAYEPRPFDILDEYKSGFGFRAKLNYDSMVFSLPFEMSLGSEVVFEDYTFSLFENLYQTQPGQGSIVGDRFAEVDQKRNYVNFFFQMDTHLTQKLMLEKGISLNTTLYSLSDVFNAGNSTQDGTYTFDDVWSPRVGVSYRIRQGKNIYASVSKGFSIPSVAETLTPEGEINTNLKPETGINYEVGLKMNWFSNALYTEVAFYSLQIDNLLVARRVAEDQYVGINAGESSHRGMEVLMNYRWFVNSGVRINPFFSAGFNDFKFKDFVDFDEDFSGNKLTGVPNYQWSLGVDISSGTGLSFYAVTRNVGEIPLNDANTLFSEAYSVTDVKAGYTFLMLKKIEAKLFGGINNVFDEKYASSILPNAVGFGNVPPRYFYPGNPRNYFVGIALTIKF
jgi:iron complex outermembrane recepter protein